jgi:thymidylate synthase (FAD)
MKTSSIPVLDHGSVELLASCASDLDVVNAARVSFDDESRELNESDIGVLKFLLRERHGSPFEHGYFRFRIKAPIFIFREWHRHRAGHSYNEWSARYSELKPEFYVPDVVLTQTGKPGSYKFEQFEDEVAEQYRHDLLTQSESSYFLYQSFLQDGVSKQQARLTLPVNTYSKMIWSCNPRSLMHFLGLRNSEQAQMEIREYAKVVEDIFADVMPVTHKAFIDNGRTAP